MSDATPKKPRKGSTSDAPPATPVLSAGRTAQKYTPEMVIYALEKSRGIKLAAARLLGCDRGTVDNYIKKSKAVRRAYDEQRAALVDVAEGQLIQRLDKGEWDAIKFILTTLGRERGYGDERKIAQLNITPDQLRTMTNAELDALAAQLDSVLAGGGA